MARCHAGRSVVLRNVFPFRGVCGGAVDGGPDALGRSATRIAVDRFTGRPVGYSNRTTIAGAVRLNVALADNKTDEETAHGPGRQSPAGQGRVRSRDPVAVGAARPPEPHRHEVRLRRGCLRGLHRARGRRGRAVVRAAGGGRGRPAHHDHRGAGRGAGQAPRAAAGLDRRAGAAMRLLPVGHADGRGGPAGQAARPQRRRHRCRHHQPVPLRHVSARADRHQACRAGAAEGRA